ncbi:hypothetical protein SAMN04489718_2867 [Actinopolyspora saharensis]|uniref:Uncharacterized protein n=1 Tax=Actinopolyspora saharensis TaxID=995062 RepID=A0A1H1F6H4_9ACTN|nr:hypothetical protein SAMN04489718_2867 [Actinopolyspora saharensis]
MTGHFPQREVAGFSLVRVAGPAAPGPRASAAAASPFRASSPSRPRAIADVSPETLIGSPCEPSPARLGSDERVGGFRNRSDFRNGSIGQLEGGGVSSSMLCVRAPFSALSARCVIR